MSTVWEYEGDSSSNGPGIRWKAIAMFPVTSRTGHEGLFISVVGKNTTWLNVSY